MAARQLHPAYTALREGIFAKHGLEVEIAAASSVAEPISILNAGRAEFAMTGTGMAVNSAIEGADGPPQTAWAVALGRKKPLLREQACPNLKNSWAANQSGRPTRGCDSPISSRRRIQFEPDSRARQGIPPGSSSVQAASCGRDR
ncbi:ABC transporter substrate-binding protein [Gemmobacter lanyuensis]